MKVKFDVYFKKNLGTLCKDNEVDLDGKEAYVNIDLNLVNRLEVNYNIGGINYTDEVTIKDIDNKEILIPFKSDVMKKGISEFEIIAYMKNGDIKASQTCIYNIEKGIGSGKQAGTGGSSNGHTHSNLNVLNSISQTKVNEWNNKADANHIHNNYASSNHTHNVSEIDGLDNISIDLSNYYTKSQTYNRTEIDNKIANIGTGGNVDLSNYYTKSETDSKIEVLNNSISLKASKEELSVIETTVKTITTMYYLSTSDTELVGGQWTENVLNQEDGKYLWTRNKIIYVNGGIEYDNAVCVTSNRDNSYIVILTKEVHTVLCNEEGRPIN